MDVSCFLVQVIVGLLKIWPKTASDKEVCVYVCVRACVRVCVHVCARARVCVCVCAGVYPNSRLLTIHDAGPESKAWHAHLSHVQIVPVFPVFRGTFSSLCISCTVVCTLTDLPCSG